MGVPILAIPNHPGQEVHSHLIGAREFLATQIGLLTRFSVPLRLRPPVCQASGRGVATGVRAAGRHLVGAGNLLRHMSGDADCRKAQVVDDIKSVGRVNEIPNRHFSL